MTERPLTLRQQLDHLAHGQFVKRGVDVLAFGMPGTVKTHAKCALGHRLVDAGRSVRSPQPTAWCKNYSSPNATCICPIGCANWTTSTSCSLTT